MNHWKETTPPPPKRTFELNLDYRAMVVLRVSLESQHPSDLTLIEQDLRRELLAMFNQALHG